MRLLTETTDYKPSWMDVHNHKTNGELSEAVECILSLQDDMDAIINELVLAINDGHLKTLQKQILRHFEDDEDLERDCDPTR